MRSIIKVEYGGKVRIFRGCDDTEVQEKVDRWIDDTIQLLSPRVNDGEYLKIARTTACDGRTGNLEVKFYDHLRDSGLTPKLLKHADFFSFRVIYKESGLVVDHGCSYIVVKDSVVPWRIFTVPLLNVCTPRKECWKTPTFLTKSFPRRNSQRT